MAQGIDWGKVKAYQSGAQPQSGEDKKVPTPPQKKAEAEDGWTVGNATRLFAGQALRIGGNYGGTIIGGLLGGLAGAGGGTVAAPGVGTAVGGVGGAAVGASIGGGLGAALGDMAAQYIEPNRDEIDLKQTAVEGLLGAVPGSMIVRQGKPLASAALGAGLSTVGSTMHKMAQGQDVTDPENWSKWDLAGIAAGGGMGYGLGRLSKKAPPSVNPNAGVPAPGQDVPVTGSLNTAFPKRPNTREQLQLRDAIVDRARQGKILEAGEHRALIQQIAKEGKLSGATGKLIGIPENKASGIKPVRPEQSAGDVSIYNDLPANIAKADSEGMEIIRKNKVEVERAHEAANALRASEEVAAAKAMEKWQAMLREKEKAHTDAAAMVLREANEAEKARQAAARRAAIDARKAGEDMEVVEGNVTESVNEVNPETGNKEGFTRRWVKKQDEDGGGAADGGDGPVDPNAPSGPVYPFGKYVYPTAEEAFEVAQRVGGQVVISKKGPQVFPANYRTTQAWKPKAPKVTLDPKTIGVDLNDPNIQPPTSGPLEPIGLPPVEPDVPTAPAPKASPEAPKEPSISQTPEGAAAVEEILNAPPPADIPADELSQRAKWTGRTEEPEVPAAPPAAEPPAVEPPAPPVTAVEPKAPSVSPQVVLDAMKKMGMKGKKFQNMSLDDALAELKNRGWEPPADGPEPPAAPAKPPVDEPSAPAFSGAEPPTEPPAPPPPPAAVPVPIEEPPAAPVPPAKPKKGLKVKGKATEPPPAAPEGVDTPSTVTDAPAQTPKEAVRVVDEEMDRVVSLEGAESAEDIHQRVVNTLLDAKKNVDYEGTSTTVDGKTTKSEPRTLTVRVPGDGVFRIKNTADAIDRTIGRLSGKAEAGVKKGNDVEPGWAPLRETPERGPMKLPRQGSWPPKESSTFGGDDFYASQPTKMSSMWQGIDPKTAQVPYDVNDFKIDGRTYNGLKSELEALKLIRKKTPDIVGRMKDIEQYLAKIDAAVLETRGPKKGGLKVKVDEPAPTPKPEAPPEPPAAPQSASPDAPATPVAEGGPKAPEAPSGPNPSSKLKPEEVEAVERVRQELTGMADPDVADLDSIPEKFRAMLLQARKSGNLYRQIKAQADAGSRPQLDKRMAGALAHRDLQALRAAAAADEFDVERWFPEAVKPKSAPKAGAPPVVAEGTPVGSATPEGANAPAPRAGAQKWSIDDVAKAFAVNKRTIERALKDGSLEFERLGQRGVRITKDALEKWAKSTNRSDLFNNFLNDTKGEANIEMMMNLGGAALGGLVGAAADEDNPLVGGAIGAAAGFGVPWAARRGVNRMAGTELESPVSAFRAIRERLPNVQRAALLSHPFSLFNNSIVGPWGAGTFGSLEKYLAGKLAGDEGLSEMGKEGLKAMANVKNLGKDFLRNMDSEGEARLMMRELERADYNEVTNPNAFDWLVEKPAEFMFAGDKSVQNALAPIFGEEAVRKMTMTNEPEGRLVGNIANWSRHRDSGGNTSLIAEMMLPFKKTAANVLTSAAERTPGLGILQNMTKPDGEKLSAAEMGAQQTIGAGIIATAYMLGRTLDPESAKAIKFRNFISNLSGQYSLLASTAFAAGQAHQEGEDAFSTVRKSVNDALPLPTTQPIADALRIPQKLSDGEPIEYRDMPAFMRPKILDLIFPPEEE